MDAFLSVQGASAPVKKKSFFSKFTRLNMLRLARAVIPAAVLMMGTVAKLAMRQPFVLFKGLTFQKLCLP
ncbi:type IV conjugative transfer system pilin TraA, partial [Escherichia coli]|uniref:type IV conjugative transfer system pilin TraA n=1 Tax=Escherichia coli TaxID=562 RepID=UPI0024BAFB53